MPDLTIEYYSVCPTTRDFHKEVVGKTGTYQVTYGPTPTGDYEYGWSCTCPQFTCRNVECKHIKATKPQRCAWNEEAFIGSSLPRPQDGKCPNCGQPLTTISIAI
jgi:hypothetical protein